MKLEELLNLKGKDSELCEKGDVYDYEVIGNIIGNDFFMSEAYGDFDEYKDILLKLSRTIYKDGRYSYLVVGVIKYENKPVILYEVYRGTSYWNVNILDNSFYEVLGKLESKYLEIYNRKRWKGREGDHNEFSWLERYRVEDNEEGVIDNL